MTITDPYDHIIWSADVPGIKAMDQALEQMPLLKYVKVDRSFIDEYGWGVFSMLAEREVLSFDDGKLTEIPSKLEKNAITHLRKAGPWMLNCMAGSVSSMDWSHPDKNELDGLKCFADVCNNIGTKPCGVTVLTTKTEMTVANEFGGRSNIDQVLWYVECLLQAGFTDVVCSPLEVAAIRRRSYFDSLELNTPGVRPAGSAARDQKRISTPAATLRAGANRLVIGGPITDGPGTYGENLAAIADEIMTLND